MYKVTISYNMQPGKEQECQDSLANKVAPGLARLGLDEARRIFLSDTWLELKTHMERITTDFQMKLVLAREEESQD